MAGPTRRPNYDRTVPETSLAEMLRARGLRLTPQRQLVLHAVLDLGHATPEQVHTAVREVAAGVNITTIYRTLELLEELGLVKHAHLGHGPPNYHLAAEAEHIHLVCRGCHTVQDVDPKAAAGLAELLERDFGFETDVHHLTVYGRCEDCRAT